MSVVAFFGLSLAASYLEWAAEEGSNMAAVLMVGLLVLFSGVAAVLYFCDRQCRTLIIGTDQASRDTFFSPRDRCYI